MVSFKEKFMEDFQNELMSFQNIPNKYSEKHRTVKTVSTQDKTELKTHNVNHVKTNNKSKLRSKIDPAFSTLEKIKSTNNNLEINRLYNALSVIENNNNINVAKKYLVGFLEERGISSLEEYINDLIK